MTTPTTLTSGPVRRILWVADNLTTGGIGTVSQYAAEALGRVPGWPVTLLSLRRAPGDHVDPATGVRHVALGLGDDAAVPFLDWLELNPHDVIVTNAVPQVEAAFRFLPANSVHVIAIHDSSLSHTDVARRNAKTADGVITVAHHVAAILSPKLEQANYRGVTATIHNGARFPPQPTRVPPQNRMRILYLGSMDPFKGVFDLAQVLRRLRRMGVPATLTIAGGSNRILADQLRQQGLEAAVTWVGWVDHKQSYELAASSDVLLMPSRKEAFGMVTIEAMAMGCVPIAYDINSGSREIIEHGKNGLLIPLGDYRRCANSIKRLYEAPLDWSRLSLGAMQRARTDFTADRMASSLIAFFLQVINNALVKPADRIRGRPTASLATAPQTRSTYQLLPATIRERIRTMIGSSPHLCHWLLSRW